MLLDETSLYELTDMDGTNLVRMLRASAKKAVGEKIVPADNKKLCYNKSQKVSGIIYYWCKVSTMIVSVIFFLSINICNVI
jgi:hypothetical protein